MDISKVGSRGVVFTFYDLSTENYYCPTNVYVINGEEHIFVCDTFLGTDSMKGVIEYIESNFKRKPIVVFNSHYDYDHHWGNCAFQAEMILGHNKCKAKIDEQGQKDLEEYKKYIRGEVILTPPDKLFEKEIKFEVDQVKFFHSPGHTEDSSSCIDLKDMILFVADNVEDPVPYIRSNLDGIKQYVKTLKDYLKLDWDTLIPGHGTITDKTLLLSNLEYLEAFPKLAKPFDLDEYGPQYYHIHLHNLSTLASIYEKEGQKDKAIRYYQDLLDLAIEHNILKVEPLDKIKDKIDSLKSK
ncbi:MAG: MBL fold metallo-hydrolase [Asgard group archaeon]|nr:MBL fold metallo-hydrolase [Asgard group archaeon]